MTDRPVLLLDMDGPLAGLDTMLWKIIEMTECPMNITGLDDPARQYYITENMLDVEDANMIRRIMDTTHIFRELPVTPGALEGVQELREHFDVWVCTKPLDANPYCRDDKMAWIMKWFPDLYAKVIMAPKKSLVHGAILLDDAPNHTCIPNSSWLPVVFTDTFNGPHSKWGQLKHWKWGDDVNELVELAAAFPYIR